MAVRGNRQYLRSDFRPTPPFARRRRHRSSNGRSQGDRVVTVDPQRPDGIPTRYDRFTILKLPVRSADRPSQNRPQQSLENRVNRVRNVP